jgi:Fur family ferric uptake transcriptional regulator
MIRSAMLALAFLTVAGATPSDATDCARWRTAFARMRSRDVAVETGVRTARFSVRLAADDEQRAAGFQCATRAEIEQTKILFDFSFEIMTAFHMQNVVAPLDIAFAKADGRIFSVQRMVPDPRALYQPLGPFRYALEARAGFFEAAGIRAGGTRLALDNMHQGRVAGDHVTLYSIPTMPSRASDLRPTLLHALAERGVRLTRARQAVLEVFAAHDGPLSVAEIRARLSGSRINVVSLYRAANLFLELGLLRVADAARGTQRFELAEQFTGHHHHLVCVRCGAVEDVDGCLLDDNVLGSLTRRLRRDRKFSVTEHDLKLYGVCVRCA